MLPRRRSEQIESRVEPEPRDCHVALPIGFATLRPERLLHLTLVIGAEIERKRSQNDSVQSVGSRHGGPAVRLHACLGRGTSFFCRAISTIDSRRSISATATRRPSGVNR